jgi:hypothetical protein
MSSYEKTWHNDAIDYFFDTLDEDDFSKKNIEKTIKKLANEIINILKES